MPAKAQHVINAMRAIRGGQDYDHRFGRRMRGQGVYADLIARRFEVACRRLNLGGEPRSLETGLFSAPRNTGGQLELFPG